jgi:hypothetical protein
MKLCQSGLLLFVTLVVAQGQAQKPPQTKTQERTPQKTVSAASNGDLFVWERPFYPVSNVPITRSATCNFKQGLSVGFQKPPSTKPKNDRVERITYSTSSENESDTVSFTNLDTKTR